MPNPKERVVRISVTDGVDFLREWDVTYPEVIEESETMPAVFSEVLAELKSFYKGGR